MRTAAIPVSARSTTADPKAKVGLGFVIICRLFWGGGKGRPLVLHRQTEYSMGHDPNLGMRPTELLVLA